MKAATTEIDPSKLAKSASQKAFATNTPQAHKLAADSHDKAAKFAIADGKMATAKKHRHLADQHRKAASIAPSLSLSQSKSSDDSPEVDEPDHDGKDENPLLTWANAK